MTTCHTPMNILRPLLSMLAVASALSICGQTGITLIEVERERHGGNSPNSPLSPPTEATPPPPNNGEVTNYVRLFSFGGTNGVNPHADLIEGSDGRLYGAALEGGRTNEAFPQG